MFCYVQFGTIHYINLCSSIHRTKYVNKVTKKLNYEQLVGKLPKLVNNSARADSRKEGNYRLGTEAIPSGSLNSYKLKQVHTVSVLQVRFIG